MARTTTKKKTSPARKKATSRTRKATTTAKAAKKKTASKARTTTRKTAAKKPVRKTTARKPAAKKTTARKAPAKKAVAKKPVVVKLPKQKTTPFAAKLSKTQIFDELSTFTGLTKKQVGSVFEELTTLISRCVKTRSVGEFTIPGLLKIVTVRKPAVKARKGINPFTGEPTIFKAKPARTVVKIRALKKLKDMA